MISIRKFLSLDTEADQALMHVVRILVNGIGEHAIEGETGERARFREGIKEVSDALAHEITPAELLVRAGSVLKALDDHNGRAVRHQRLQTEELQNMVKMLASTVKVVSAAGDSNTGVLGDIEKRIEVVSALDDVRVIKARLSDCLIDIRREAERQHTANGEIIEQLTHELNQARKLVAGQQGGNARDLITGLPLRPEAEAALAQSGRAGVRAYAAVFVLDRLQILNVRFGREAGDETLVAFACMVENHLAAGDRLFRWGGPALLAILPRADSIESVRSELGRMMATKLEHSIRTPSRNIMVPITARWTLFPMMAASRLMFQKIDTFAAAPASRE